MISMFRTVVLNVDPCVLAKNCSFVYGDVIWCYALCHVERPPVASDEMLQNIIGGSMMPSLGLYSYQ